MFATSDSFPAAVCPVDLSELQPGDSGLVCASAGHGYAVQQGIPRLLSSTSNYADGFGAQWHQYRVTQLDSYTGTTISADRLRRCLGEELWAKLQQPSQRLAVLETGCGAGRFTEILSKLPAAFVTSTDLSAAAGAAGVAASGAAISAMRRVASASSIGSTPCARASAPSAARSSGCTSAKVAADGAGVWVGYVGRCEGVRLGSGVLGHTPRSPRPRRSAGPLAPALPRPRRCAGCGASPTKPLPAV